MRKVGLLILALLLMVSSSYAQSPREGTSAEGKSTFANIAAVGLDVTGVPGYIELYATDNAGVRSRWYLFVNGATGELIIASSAQVGTTTAAGSPQTTTWFTGGSGTVGTKVGSQ